MVIQRKKGGELAPPAATHNAGGLCLLRTRCAGSETAVCGPEPWGLELELPSSWSKAIAGTTLDETDVHPLQVCAM